MAAKNETRRPVKPPAGQTENELPRGADPAGTGAKQIDRETIARRAYERYEKRGKTPGHEEEDWFDAERELKGGGGHAGGHQG